MYKQSIYNLIYEDDNKYYIFNSLSCALSEIIIDLYEAIKNNNLDNIVINQYIDQLIKGGYLIDQKMNEINLITYKISQQKMENRLSLTIVPTLSCNCYCSYCYELHNNDFMDYDVYQSIQNYILKNFLDMKIDSVSITWYGGEPLLAKKDILSFYENLSKYINKNKIRTSIITNGVLLDRVFLSNLLNYTVIKFIQVTLDGSEKKHNEKRYLSNKEGTYNIIIENIKKISLLSANISIRVNVDKNSIDTIDELIEELKKEKINKISNVGIYLGCLSKISDQVKEDSNIFLNKNEFKDLELEFQKKLIQNGFMKGAALYPKPLSTCMYSHYNSFVVLPNGDLYKCWNMIGIERMKAGNIKTIHKKRESQFYQTVNYSPIEIKECRECFFLPICLGGCPYLRNENEKSKSLRESSCLNKENLIKILKIKTRHENYLRSVGCELSD